MKCTKCGRDNGWYSISGLCDGCKSQRTRTIMLASLPLMILFGLVGGILGEVQYDYEIDRCNSMTSDSSAYEFTHDIQRNAEYTKKCFEIKEHPLSHLGYTGGGVLTGVLLTAFIMAMIAFVATFP